MELGAGLRTALAGALLMFCGSASLAQTIPVPTTQPVIVPRTCQFELAAEDGYPYRIFVAEAGGPAPERGFAVLYVLDANTMFLTVVEAVRFQKGLHPTIVVGIGHHGEKPDMKRRFWDLTPPTPADHLVPSPIGIAMVAPEGTGGEDAFCEFIETRLKPEIARLHEVDADRQAICGHSLSARFVLHVLATHPEAFQTYLACSPSAWWDNGSIFNELATLKGQTTPRRVLITIGEYEQKTTPTASPARVAFLAQAKMVDHARAIARQLQTVDGISVHFREQADENHGSIVPLAIGAGVRIALTATPPEAPTTAPAE